MARISTLAAVLASVRSRLPSPAAPAAVVGSAVPVSAVSAVVAARGEDGGAEDGDAADSEEVAAAGRRHAEQGGLLVLAQLRLGVDQLLEGVAPPGHDRPVGVVDVPHLATQFVSVEVHGVVVLLCRDRVALRLSRRRRGRVRPAGRCRRRRRRPRRHRWGRGCRSPAAMVSTVAWLASIGRIVDVAAAKAGSCSAVRAKAYV